MTPINQKFQVISTYTWDTKTHIPIPAGTTHILFGDTDTPTAMHSFITIRNTVGGPDLDTPVLLGFPFAFKAATIAALQGISASFLQVTN